MDKALEYGVEAALEEEQRSGRPPEITEEAKPWIIELACQKPKDLGYSYEVWTTRLLARHIREHAESQGHACLKKLAPGSISRLMSAMEIQPHKINYYLQRRDPDFDTKRAQVLHVYQQVEFIMENEEIKSLCDVYLSYDEKPGIQAIENTVEDLPPVPRADWIGFRVIWSWHAQPACRN